MMSAYTIIYRDLLYYLYTCIATSNIINKYYMFVILNGMSIQGVCVHNSPNVPHTYVCITGEIHRIRFPLHAVIVFNSE